MARRKRVAFEISAREKKATASLRKVSARFQKIMAPVDRLNRKLRQTQRALQPVILDKQTTSSTSGLLKAWPTDLV